MSLSEYSSLRFLLFFFINFDCPSSMLKCASQLGFALVIQLYSLIYFVVVLGLSDRIGNFEVRVNDMLNYVTKIK